ncbi:MAG: hypothetical protein WA160_00395 [Pseudobdellovibrio sp.]
MFLVSCIIPMFICIIIGGYFVYKTDPSSSVLLLEYTDLFMPIVIWNFLILNSVILNSSCLTEVYILSLLILGYVYLKFKFPTHNIGYSLVGSILLNYLPFALRN